MRRTRVLAMLAVLVVIAAVVSDDANAEELDRGLLELALRIVPVEWWHERLGTGDPPEARS